MLMMSPQAGGIMEHSLRTYKHEPWCLLALSKPHSFFTMARAIYCGRTDIKSTRGLKFVKTVVQSGIEVIYIERRESLYLYGTTPHLLSIL